MIPRTRPPPRKLQGYWILEIGELAGLRKAEVETLRSFLSRQNDIYRAAFGRRATPHPRQCMFFGTTNAESGYLRDTTGNRRFWPVKTPGNGKKQSWNLTHEEILPDLGGGSCMSARERSSTSPPKWTRWPR